MTAAARQGQGQLQNEPRVPGADVNCPLAFWDTHPAPRSLHTLDGRAGCKGREGLQGSRATAPAAWAPPPVSESAKATITVPGSAFVSTLNTQALQMPAQLESFLGKEVPEVALGKSNKDGVTLCVPWVLAQQSLQIASRRPSRKTERRILIETKLPAKHSRNMHYYSSENFCC